MMVLPRPLASVPHFVHLYAVNVPAAAPVSAQSCVRASRGKMPCFADFMGQQYTLLVSLGGLLAAAVIVGEKLAVPRAQRQPLLAAGAGRRAEAGSKQP
jgi:hypothetical protein